MGISMLKRKSSFSATWEKEFKFIERSRKGENAVSCRYCKCDIIVSVCGKGPVIQNVETTKQKSNTKGPNIPNF